MITVLHTESSDGWGGQEIRIVQESLGMIKRGYRVLIAAHEKSGILGRAKDRGIPVFPAGFSKKNPDSLRCLIELIGSEEVKIVNTHSSADSWVATTAAKLSSLRPAVIRTRHLSTPVSRSFLSRMIYDSLPDAVMTTGEEIRQRMINFNGFKAEKILSVPTGVDMAEFDPSAVRPTLVDPGESRFSVGMVGVLRSWKGHSYFIEAVPEILRDIPDAIFYIVGSGPQFENIRGLIKNKSLEDRIIMTGHREDIPGVLASLSVVVHPSYGHEGVPQTLLQAMAMKRPVVAADAGAIKEIVRDGQTGFLINPRNAGDIAARVVRLCREPELAHYFGEQGRMLVKGAYSFENMLDTIEDLYRKVLAKRKT